MGPSDARWARWSTFIGRHLGLHFPPERLTDLQRGLAAAAKEFGFADLSECADRLLSAPPTKAQLQVLASHLTVGETYFFRDRALFDVLASRVLPDLIRERRGREQRLRLWSAACCTGEEAYSLAILVHQLLPDLADWRVTILATDINPRFLRKAAAGAYGEWSFRDAPTGLRERYFSHAGGGPHTILPEIRRLVTFGYLNLAEGVYPSLATDTNAMDLILCRNVLMYFGPAQVRKAIDGLHHALVDGGRLVVSPSEASQALFPQFTTQNFPGAILYQKSAMCPAPVLERVWVPEPPIMASPPAPPLARPPADPAQAKASPTPYALASSLYQQGRYGEAADTLTAWAAARTPGSDVCALLARALANQGKLAEAVAWCDRWIAADKLDAAGHYVRAAVLLEQGEHDAARRSLQRVLYLDPDFALAEFALGNLAHSSGQPDEARRHFGAALRLLARQQPDRILLEADGLTAGRLSETITALECLT